MWYCWISFKNSLNADKYLKKMVSSMAHRGPDADGFFNDNNIGIGHRRLSIIDLNERSNQPLYSNDGRYLIVFNGEIYNYKKLKSKIIINMILKLIQTRKFYWLLT